MHINFLDQLQPVTSAFPHTTPLQKSLDLLYPMQALELSPRLVDFGNPSERLGRRAMFKRVRAANTPFDATLSEPLLTTRVRALPWQNKAARRHCQTGMVRFALVR